jgi:hypothetical protein
LTTTQLLIGDEFAAQTQHEDAKTAYALSLYSKISNITWDYSAPIGYMSGCIGNDAAKGFENFTIDLNKTTSYDVANTLWDKIAEGMQRNCA